MTGIELLIALFFAAQSLLNPLRDGTPQGFEPIGTHTDVVAGLYTDPNTGSIVQADSGTVTGYYRIRGGTGYLVRVDGIPFVIEVFTWGI